MHTQLLPPLHGAHTVGLHVGLQAPCWDLAACTGKTKSAFTNCQLTHLYNPVGRPMQPEVQRSHDTTSETAMSETA